jgi:menaquinone reductase, multiheme cytochrome c subunit
MKNYRGSIIFLAGVLMALLAGWRGFPLILYQRAEQPVDFSHAVHQDKAGMKCADCHAFRDDGTFAGIPRLDKCSGCHTQAMGATSEEKKFIDTYVTPNREVPWLVYSRQPDNVHFSHIEHVKLGKLACERCHGLQGKTDKLRPYEQDRISGYSRDIWGHSMSRIGLRPGDGKKMTDCESCHRERGVAQAESCLACHK